MGIVQPAVPDERDQSLVAVREFEAPELVEPGSLQQRFDCCNGQNCCNPCTREETRDNDLSPAGSSRRCGKGAGVGWLIAQGRSLRRRLPVGRSTSERASGCRAYDAQAATSSFVAVRTSSFVAGTKAGTSVPVVGVPAACLTRLNPRWAVGARSPVDAPIPRCRHYGMRGATRSYLDLQDARAVAVAQPLIPVRYKCSTHTWRGSA